MLKFENVIVSNLEGAIRGMRNSFSNWEKSDTYKEEIGPEDLKLAKKLVVAGGSHRKFLRQIFVSVDLTAPLYFWKQLDTYKVGTVRNSTSTMHTIMRKPFTEDMFSFENDYLTLDIYSMPHGGEAELTFEDAIEDILYMCNLLRQKYLETKDKQYWRALIQLLPSGFNQMSTMTFNYEGLRNIYFDRLHHRLGEWQEFCEWISNLPHANNLITYEGEKNG